MDKAAPDALVLLILQGEEVPIAERLDGIEALSHGFDGESMASYYAEGEATGEFDKETQARVWILVFEAELRRRKHPFMDGA